MTQQKGPFLGAVRNPGEKSFQRIPIGEFADGSPILQPVCTITGRKDGPTVYIQGGMHGDETTGIEIVRQTIRAIKPEDVTGSLVIVPVANVPSYLTRARGYLLEERWLIDVNRVFPGSAGGLLSERIAYILLNEFVLQADFTLDLHAALDGCDIVPFTYVIPSDDNNGTLEARKRIAHIFGVPFVYYKSRSVPFGTSDLGRSIAMHADAAHKPIVMAEMGESRRIKHEVVPLGVAGVRRSLQSLGALPGEPEPHPESQRAFENITIVHANRGGGVRVLIKLGQELEKGQKLAEIVDVFGNTVEELFAPVAGFAMRVVKLANVATGAEVMWIGH